MNARDADTVTRPGPPDQVDAGPEAGRRPLSTDPWLRVDGYGADGVPAAGQPGHGRTASLRRQPVRIVEGRMKGGYTDVFELICGECGDHPYLDYWEIPPRLQLIRGPYPLEAGLTRWRRASERMRSISDRPAASAGRPFPRPTARAR